ncbi:SDR family oxidoreductase [soil metagenome]
MTNIESLGTAVITGASAGIGATYARRLAHRGYDVVLVARNEERLKKLAAEITVDTGRSAEFVVADLANQADVARVAALLRADERITLLVNNAGIARLSPLETAEPDDSVLMIDLNITALTQLSQSVLPGFIARERGGIVNIASAMALWAMSSSAVYSGTKAYVLMLTRGIAEEVAGKGIQVQAVLPGAIRTDLWNDSGVSLDQFPDSMVMSVDDVVDAALAGWDRGELITIPSLEDAEAWDAFEAQRTSMIPGLSLNRPASRYLQTVS